jgi:hypothetical protein
MLCGPSYWRRRWKYCRQASRYKLRWPWQSLVSAVHLLLSAWARCRICSSRCFLFRPQWRLTCGKTDLGFLLSYSVIWFPVLSQMMSVSRHVIHSIEVILFVRPCKQELEATEIEAVTAQRHCVRVWILRHFCLFVRTTRNAGITHRAYTSTEHTYGPVYSAFLISFSPWVHILH